MSDATRLVRSVLAAVLAVSMVLPIPALGGSSLGTARGAKAVKLSIDGGKTWLPLDARSLPVLPGTELKATSGSAGIELVDGSRMTALPFTAMAVREIKGKTEISVSYGRILFRLPEATRVEIVTPTARLQAVPGKLMVGEVFVTGAGMTGLKMSEGQLQVRELNDQRRVMVASLEPVFLPKRPEVSGSFFTTDAPTAVPDGAKAAFNPAGESIGYIGPDRLLVVYPGFSNDLTKPFSPKLVRLAMASVPAEHRTDDTMPVFDVHGGYVGYLSGSVFYAQAQTQAPAQQPAKPAAPQQTSGMSAGAATALGVGVGLGVLGLGVAGASGAFSSDDSPSCPPPSATPVTPPPIGCP